MSHPFCQPYGDFEEQQTPLNTKTTNHTEKKRDTRRKTYAKTTSFFITQYKLIFMFCTYIQAPEYFTAAMFTEYYPAGKRHADVLSSPLI